MREDEWEVTATAAVATQVVATKAGVAGKRHIIRSVLLSYDGAAVGQADVQRAGATTASHYVQNSDVVQLAYRGAVHVAGVSGDVSVVLAAVAARIGRVTITGYTEG